MPRTFKVNGAEYQMSLPAIGRIEDAFGKSALEIFTQLQVDWTQEGDDGKVRLLANKIRLGDAYKLMAAATGLTPDEVVRQTRGVTMLETVEQVLVAFADEVAFLVRGKEEPGAGESAKNPLPAADASTSGG